EMPAPADLAVPRPDLVAKPCDLKCPVGERCINGGCICDGTTRCGSDCVDISIDNAHCGACGHACPMGQLCGAGQCSLSCPLGQTGCNGRCADVMTDGENCGACGHACATGQKCVGGQCC